MDNDELKTALLEKCPVIYKDFDGNKINFDSVDAIIYRNISGTISVSVELLDKCKNSIIVCDPARVKRKETK